MTQAAGRLSFEDYLNLNPEAWPQDWPQGRVEFVEGELRALPPESGPNDAIANYLFLLLVSAGLPFQLVRPGKCELVVPALQAKDPRTRMPDLVVLQPEHLPLIERRLTIRMEASPPQLVVEVVSPGDANRRRDYERKREQYQARSIPEYWLIDPALQTVTVLELEANQYRHETFQAEQPMHSSFLGRLPLVLTAAQLFAMR